MLVYFSMHINNHVVIIFELDNYWTCNFIDISIMSFIMQE